MGLYSNQIKRTPEYFTLKKECLERVDKFEKIYSALPHPKESWAKKGKTMLDYALYCIDKAGENGLFMLRAELDSIEETE